MSPSEAGDCRPWCLACLTEKKRTGQSWQDPPPPEIHKTSLKPVILRVLKPPQRYTIPPPNSLLCKSWYVLIWGGNKIPPRLGFCFKPLALGCRAEMSCSHTPAQQPWVGFYWLPPSWRRFACHSQQLSTNRGTQEKATVALLFFQGDTSKKRICSYTLIIHDLYCSHFALHCPFNPLVHYTRAYTHTDFLKRLLL